MRKILLIVCIFLFIAQNAHAYLVETQDKYAYSGQNGMMKKDKPLKSAFEIDEVKGYIYEVTAVVNMDGNKIDFAKYNPAKWKIISSENGNIVAKLITDKSEQILVFRNDGLYYLFQSFHNTPIPDGSIIPLFTSFFYGEYKKL